MAIDVREALAYPGRQFPVHIVLKGRSKNDNDLRTVEEITIEGHSFAQVGVLYLEIAITARVSQPCCRCLAPVTSTVELEESLEVPIPAGAASVELRPTLLRLVLSSHNPNVLCREDCRGLCPACGTNLNRNPDHVCHGPENERRTLRDFLT
jgi:uncharacterized protein